MINLNYIFDADYSLRIAAMWINRKAKDQPKDAHFGFRAAFSLGAANLTEILESYQILIGKIIHLNQLKRFV